MVKNHIAPHAEGQSAGTLERDSTVLILHRSFVRHDQIPITTTVRIEPHSRHATSDRKRKNQGNIPSVMSARNVKSTLSTPDLLHLQPMLTLWLSFRYPHLLKKHICSIEDTRSVSRIRTFVAAEFCELGRLDSGRFLLVGMVLSKQVAAELGGCGVGFA